MNVWVAMKSWCHTGVLQHLSILVHVFILGFLQRRHSGRRCGSRGCGGGSHCSRCSRRGWLREVPGWPCVGRHTHPTWGCVWTSGVTNHRRKEQLSVSPGRSSLSFTEQQLWKHFAPQTSRCIRRDRRCSRAGRTFPAGCMAGWSRLCSGTAAAER